MSRKQLANDTLALIERGRYDAPSGRPVVFEDEQAASVSGTVLYRPEAFASSGDRPIASSTDIRMTVTDETTQVAAQRLAARDIAILNFASARNPGGGFLNGAKAQEEDLCRCSGLYPTLLTQRAYYLANRGQQSLHYTDHVIYSPRVPFFRLRSRGPLVEEVFLPSVITAPAPNSGPFLRRHRGQKPALAATFERRWRIVLTVAERHGHRVVVLGAWGCGAFGGDPVVASRTALVAANDFRDAFDEIVFAIPATGKRSLQNHRAFEEAIASQS